MTTAKHNILSALWLSLIITVVFSLSVISCNKKDKQHKTETPLVHHQLSQEPDSLPITYTDSIDADTTLDQEASPKDKVLLTRSSKQPKQPQAILPDKKSTSIVTPVLHTGREIKAKELESYNWKNMRLMLQDYETIFEENDYITGEQLAMFIHHKSTASNSVKKLTRWFITKNIDRIEKTDKNLFIRTKDGKDIDEKLHIPGLVNVQLKINDKTKITLGNSFQSKTDPFTKRYMLPMDIDGIEVVNQGNQLSLKGFVCGDLLYTNYPKTTDGIPLRLK